MPGTPQKTTPSPHSLIVFTTLSVGRFDTTNDQTTPFGQNFRDFFGQFGFGNTPNMPPQTAAVGQSDLARPWDS
jgi:hypothetical protein